MLENQTDGIVYSNMPPIKTKYENDSGENFTLEEWAYFMDEVNMQIGEGNQKINFKKAVNNARYLAKLDAALASTDGITFTPGALEKFVDEVRKI